MGIGDARRARLGYGAGHHELEEILGRFPIVVRIFDSRPGRYQSRFNCFVDDKVHYGFGYTKVRRCDAFVKTLDTL